MSSSNQQKKLQKKLHRHQQIVTKECGIVTLSSPTKNLAICNAGQVNGLTEDTIIENFSKYGDLENVLLLPGKSCAFFTYKTENSARDAFENCNGILNIAQDGKPVYLSYVEALPCQVDEGKTWGELPPGLVLLPDFVNCAEEETLMQTCQFSGGVLKHRQVRHFGYEFRYDTNNVDKDEPLEEKVPPECDFLFEKLHDKKILRDRFQPDQLTVNFYKPGQGIPPHVDTHSAFEDPILSLSLGSDVVMEFKKKSKIICVLLPRRSLLVMSGESRYDWSHGITPKTYDFHYISTECKSFKRETRISFTFRKILRDSRCSCAFPENCDSRRGNPGGIRAEEAAKLEDLHVHNVYEDIAPHFSETRHKPWPNVLDFINTFEVGDVLVDVGCGNGKYFGHNRKIYEIGIDRSFKLNEFSSGRGFQTVTGNCLHLPFLDNSADGVISIAVIHHLATEERRLHALQEISRILRPGGLALIYVWAKEQVNNNEKSTYIKQDRKNRKGDLKSGFLKTPESVLPISGEFSLPIHVNRTDFSHSDLLVPWKRKNAGEKDETFLRFYHVFEDGELETLCTRIQPRVQLQKSFYDQGNCCVSFRKV